MDLQAQNKAAIATIAEQAEEKRQAAKRKVAQHGVKKAKVQSVAQLQYDALASCLQIMFVACLAQQTAILIHKYASVQCASVPSPIAVFPCLLSKVNLPLKHAL